MAFFDLAPFSPPQHNPEPRAQTARGIFGGSPRGGDKHPIPPRGAPGAMLWADLKSPIWTEAPLAT